MIRARLCNWSLFGFDGTHFVDLIELFDHVALCLISFLEAVQQLGFFLLQLFGELLRAEGIVVPRLHPIHVSLVEAQEVALICVVEVGFCSPFRILNILERSLFCLQKCILVAHHCGIDFLLLALEP